jgi:hypothetical protein
MAGFNRRNRARKQLCRVLGFARCFDCSLMIKSSFKLILVEGFPVRFRGDSAPAF